MRGGGLPFAPCNRGGRLIGPPALPLQGDAMGNDSSKRELQQLRSTYIDYGMKMDDLMQVPPPSPPPARARQGRSRGRHRGCYRPWSRNASLARSGCWRQTSSDRVPDTWTSASWQSAGVASCNRHSTQGIQHARLRGTPAGVCAYAHRDV